MTNIKKEYDTISGRDFESVRGELLKKTTVLYRRLEKNFENLAKKSRQPNVREILHEFAKEAERDRTNLASLIKGNSEYRIETAESSYGMFDHIDSSDASLFNEEERAIIEAMKISKDLKDIFTIISSEYSDSNIKHTFNTLAKHEIYRKNELEELYEELIVKGEW